MIIRPEALNASGKQPELDPELYYEADVVKGERFECRHEFRQILFSADRPRHASPPDPACRHPPGPIKDLPPVSGDVGSFVESELGLGDKLFDEISGLNVFSIQQTLEMPRIESDRL